MEIESLPLAADWLLKPLKDLHEFKEKGWMESDVVTSSEVAKTVELVLSALQHVHTCGLLDLAPNANARLECLLRVFRLGPEVYTHSSINRALESLWSVSLKTFDKHTRWPFGEGHSLRLYQVLVEDFVSMSFLDGNDLLVKYLMLALRMHYVVDFRLEVFNSDRFLALCKIKIGTLAGSVSQFLVPAEADHRLLQLYTVALLGNKISADTNSALYWIAVHHLNCFIFNDTCGYIADDVARPSDPAQVQSVLRHRCDLVAQLFTTAGDGLYRNLMFYVYKRNTPIESFTPPTLNKLTDGRNQTLLDLVQLSPEITALAKQRHPSLFD